MNDRVTSADIPIWPTCSPNALSCGTNPSFAGYSSAVMDKDLHQISIATAHGGSFDAYLALPDSEPAPAIICIQEVYGVNRFMRAITDFWASRGFLAICPDIYWRLGPGIELDPLVEGDGDRAMAIAADLDRPQAVEDIATAIGYLRDMAECTGKVGTTGYCLGGLLSYLVGTRYDADCNVGYYPVGIEGFLDEAQSLSRPLMLHIGEADPYTPPEVRAQFSAALANNPLVSIHSYPGIGHAFARPGAPSYAPQAADLANERSAEFFHQNLA